MCPAFAGYTGSEQKDIEPALMDFIVQLACKRNDLIVKKMTEEKTTKQKSTP